MNPILAARVTMGIVLGSILLVTGCTTKRRADLKAQEAYLAGQQRAMAQQQLPAGNIIQIVGDVKRSVLEWSDGLTISQAIVEAEYQNARQPLAILVYRRGQILSVNPSDLLRGRDLVLEPGDRIELQR